MNTGDASSPGDPRDLVLGIWKTLLEVDDANDNDNFFELGGDSLLAMEFTASVEDRLGVDLALDEFFDDPTFGSIVMRVSESRAG